MRADRYTDMQTLSSQYFAPLYRGDVKNNDELRENQALGIRGAYRQTRVINNTRRRTNVTNDRQATDDG